MSARGDTWRIAASMTAACALGAFLLGGVFVATDRYQERAKKDGERRAVNALLGLGPSATLLSVRQYLDPERERVLYVTEGTRSDSVYVFSYDGRLLDRHAPGVATAKGLTPAGRMLIAREGGAAKGFVVEGDTRGYKNRIRFFVALDPQFRISGVQVLEHEEDPGLGAETATPWFTRQFVGRTPSGLEALSVTRDPLPEDWRAALFEKARGETPAWSARHRDLVNRMDAGPIHAVTGATISSRAVTDGVRATVLHFQRRWNLLEPYLGGRS